MNMISILLTLFFIQSFTLSDSLSNETDYLSLMDFKSSITNSDNVLGKNWTSSTSFCSWIGVTCSSRRQRVTELILPDMGLEGEISASIGNLTFLINLDLSDNSFYGSFPFELCRFPRLRSLIVYQNNLAGSIHPSVVNFTQLQRLDLYENNFVGGIPGEIGNMSQLTWMSLRNNQLTGSIPPAIFNSSSLLGINLANNSLSGPLLLNGEYSLLSPEFETIDLYNNQLTGEIPSGLCRFRELKRLRLSYNNFGGQIPENIDCLSKLEELHFSQNRISGNIPPSLGNVSTLHVLHGAENSITGPIPPELGNLINLKWLRFSFNNLTGEIPRGIFNLTSLRKMSFITNKLSGHIPGVHLPNLEKIYLANNRLQGEIPLSIANASKLQDLELSGNSLIGPVPSNLGNLRELVTLNLGGNKLTQLDFFDSLVECRMLEYLVINNNPLGGSLPNTIQNLSTSIQFFGVGESQISGQIPTGIGNLSGMITFEATGNSLTGNIPVEIGRLNKLQRLYLNTNGLHGNIPVELCNLVNLGVIRIRENDLSGPIPSCIGNLTRVQELHLSSNRLTSTLPSGLWELDGLLNLDLSRNLIQGELHSDIRKLERIVTIDLSSNQFSSTVPSSLGELKYLVLLNLSSNSMDGSIPSSFGDFMSLEILDLSWNNLSGSIPASLENLSHLKEINFSYNKLQGEIPHGGIFLNSPRGAFEGNRDLCGMTSLGFPLCRTHNNSQWSRSKKLIIRIIIPVTVSVTLIMIALSMWILKRRRRATQEDVELVEVSGLKKIPYHEILRGTDNFSDANLLGVGSSGSVFKAILPGGETVAVKVFNLDGNECKKRFDAECEVLKHIRHRNLVHVITTCSNDFLKAIILPYMPNGNLDIWLYKEDRFLDLHARIEVMLDVAMAVEYLHHGNDFPVVHCDLKPSNVLLDDDMVAHVSDFGISKLVSGEKVSVQTKTLGTIGYIAPEYGSDGTVSTAGDVYSYGIMLMEVLVRRKPTAEFFSDNLSLRQWVKEAFPNSLRKVVDATLFPDEENGFTRSHIFIHSLIELSLHCSSEAPEVRITMEDVVVRLTKIKESFSRNKAYI